MRCLCCQHHARHTTMPRRLHLFLECELQTGTDASRVFLTVAKFLGHLIGTLEAHAVNILGQLVRVALNHAFGITLAVLLFYRPSQPARQSQLMIKDTALALQLVLASLILFYLVAKLRRERPVKVLGPHLADTLHLHQPLPVLQYHVEGPLAEPIHDVLAQLLADSLHVTFADILCHSLCGHSSFYFPVLVKKKRADIRQSSLSITSFSHILHLNAGSPHTSHTNPTPSRCTGWGLSCTTRSGWLSPGEYSVGYQSPKPRC